MRPIHLRFKGLHSYRHVQEIDFETLCEGGLFGIFGPTGSGKSTVLDAITLALYARVERAGGQRQGILNEACDELWVDFTFDLGSDEQRKRYQVERRYRRSGPNSVNVTFARLIEHQGEFQHVIADKDRDVNEAIQEILGLTHSDFTRAVVLPQGKFAEFLSMNDADRRAMLERLFSLQAYGKRLLDRIKSRLDVVTNELSKVEGAQSTLGDASKAAVERAGAATKAAERDAENARSHLDKSRAAYEAAERFRAVQQELTTVRQELQQLEQAEPEIRLAKEELRLAEAAEPIRRDLEAVEDARREHKEAAAAMQAAQERHRQAKGSYEQACQEYEKARQIRQGEEPELIAKRSRLQEAVGQEQQLKERLLQVERVREEAQRLKRALQQTNGSIGDVKAQLATAEEHLRVKELEMRECSVDPAHRRAMNTASAALARWVEAEEEVARASAELQAAQERLAKVEDDHKQAEHTAQFYKRELNAAERDLRQLKLTPPTDEQTLASDGEELARLQARVEQLGSLLDEVTRLEQTVRTAQSRIDSLREDVAQATECLQRVEEALSHASTGLETAEDTLRLAEIEHQAATLARQLSSGDPCPVCGSTHHPSPATESEVNAGLAKRVRDAKEQLRVCEAELAKAREEKLILENQLSDALSRLDDDQQQLARARFQLQQGYAGLPNQWQDLDIETLHERLTAERTIHDQRKQAAKEWNDQVAALREELERRRRQADREGAKAADQARLLAAAQATMESCKTALGRAERTRDQYTAEFRRAAGSLSADDVQAESERIHEADARAEALHDEIDQLRSSVATHREQLERLQSQAATLQQDVARAESDLRVLQQEIDQRTHELHALTDGQPVQELLDRVSARLRVLEESESQAGKRQDASRADLSTAERTVAAAEQRLNEAERRVKECQLRLEQQLSQAEFGSAEAAMASLRPIEVREQLRSQIDTHARAVERLKDREATLDTQLGDVWIDDATWERMKQTAEEAQKDHEAALGRLSVAKQQEQDLRKKHATWLDLEAQRKAAQKLKNQLNQLQVLCRGRQFVEFVAEEYLASVTIDASERLGSLTSGRYALELDSSGGFVIRDDSNGGVRRPVSSLSGGETFITSLALALALSKQIQLHGTYPLEFFFLDEGFGTLDPELLETVMTSLERLRSEQVSIGIISHVPELRQRVSRRLVVHHARESERGSYLEFERA